MFGLAGTGRPGIMPLMERMLDIENNGLREHEIQFLMDIRKEFAAFWELQEDQHPLFMVRLSRAGQPSMRSLRRPVSELFLQVEHIPGSISVNK